MYPPQPPPRIALATFDAILNGLIRAVDGPRMWGILDRVLAHLILHRLALLRQRFQRLHARIEAGTYRPGRPPTTPRRQPENPKPRAPSPFPARAGWLLTLLPGEMTYRIHARNCRSGLERLLQEPEMLALMRAAPGPMRRALRPICWMLHITPPPILANPAARRPTAAEPAPAAEPRSPPRSPPQSPRRSPPRSPPQAPAPKISPPCLAPRARDSPFPA